MIPFPDTSNSAPTGSAAPASGVAKVGAVDIESSDYYREAGERAERSEEVIKRIEEEQQAEPGGFARAITAALEELLALGKLDGLTIASSDGLVIAETSRLPNADTMAAIGSVFEYVADRAQQSGIVSSVDEMTLLGTRGELAVVRYFPALDRRFFLMAYARERCAYRRITGLALKRCGLLLERKFGRQG